MMQSSSDFSKIALKGFISAIIDGGDTMATFLNQVTNTSAVQRLLYLRQKANGSNKLSIKQITCYFEELITDKSNIEAPMWKRILNLGESSSKSVVDSDGNVDLTQFFAGFMVFHKKPFVEKMQMVFSAVDQNGDGYLSRDEVQKFFTIILAHTLNLLKNAIVNPSHFSVSPNVAKGLQDNLPEFEKIFDPSKVPRLVDGAFTADTNHDGLISHDEWSTWIETSDFKTQWGTVSLLFDN